MVNKTTTSSVHAAQARAKKSMPKPWSGTPADANTGKTPDLQELQDRTKVDQALGAGAYDRITKGKR